MQTVEYLDTITKIQKAAHITFGTYIQIENEHESFFTAV